MIKRTWEDVNSMFYLSTHAAGHDMEKSLHVVYVTCLYYS